MNPLCTFPGIHGYTFKIQKEKSFCWTALRRQCWRLGLNLVQMAPDLTEDDLQILVDAYKGLANQPSEEVRQACVKRSLIHDIFMHIPSYLCANQFLFPTASLVPVTQPESFTPMKIKNPTSRSVEGSWLHLPNSHVVMAYVLHVHPILIILVVYMYLVGNGQPIDMFHLGPIKKIIHCVKLTILIQSVMFWTGPNWLPNVPCWEDPFFQLMFLCLHKGRASTAQKYFSIEIYRACGGHNNKVCLFGSYCSCLHLTSQLF